MYYNSLPINLIQQLIIMTSSDEGEQVVRLKALSQ